MAVYFASDTDLTAVADAIRTKGGTSAPLEFPAEFISAIAAISGGGGGSVQQGNFTLESPGKTFTIPLSSSVSFMVFYASDYPNGTAGAGWHVVGGSWMNGQLFTTIRYNEANTTGTTNGTVIATNSTLTVQNLQYNMLANKTFYWYAG